MSEIESEHIDVMLNAVLNLTIEEGIWGELEEQGNLLIKAMDSLNIMKVKS
jgi:hypothetical protein